MARDASDTLGNARKITPNTRFQAVAKEAIGKADRNDYFKFRSRGTNSIDLTLTGLKADANVDLLNRNGNALARSRRTGRKNEEINLNVGQGLFYVRVYPRGRNNRTSYSLNMSSNRDRAGNTPADARRIAFTEEIKTFSDYVSKADRQDYYRFTVAEGDYKNIDLSLKGLSANANLRLVDADGNLIKASNRNGKRAERIKTKLEEGTYFALVSPKGRAKTSYNFGISGADVPDGAGNNLLDAKPIEVDFTSRTYSDFISNGDTEDFYKFTVNNSGEFRLTLSGLSADADVELLDEFGVGVPGALSANTGNSNETINAAIEAGEYFIRVYQPAPGNNTLYDMQVRALPEDGAPNTVGEAFDITDALENTSFNNPVRYPDFVGAGVDDNDYYQFTLTESSSINLDLKDLTGNADVQLLNADGVTAFETSARSGSAAESIRGVLDPGTYFIRVYPGNGNASSYYNMDISAVPTNEIPGFVKDIRIGEESSSPSSLTNVGGELYFVVNDGVNGFGLWKSNGTLETTKLIQAFPDVSSANELGNLTAIDGTVYFTAQTADTGIELWKTNGTAAGTTLVKDILPGGGSSSIANLTRVGDTLYFTANTDENSALDFELWKSDGTANGTVQVADLQAGEFGSFPDNLIDLNGTLYFTANNGTNGEELYRINAQGQPQLLEIRTGNQGSGAANFTVVNDTLYFSASNGTGAGQFGTEIWQVTNGAAPTRVTDIVAGNGNTLSLSNFTNFGGELYFAASNGSASGIQLWKLDGTQPSGAVQVTNVTTSGGIGFAPEQLKVVGSNLFFVGNDDNGREVWKYNAVDGASIVKNIVPNSIDPDSGDTIIGSSNPGSLIAAGGFLYFTANTSANGQELWRSDGTEQNTQIVFDIFDGPDGSSPSGLVNINDRLFFNANDGVNGSELWVLG